jgi:hypothetical protein
VLVVVVVEVVPVPVVIPVPEVVLASVVVLVVVPVSGLVVAVVVSVVVLVVLVVSVGVCPPPQAVNDATTAKLAAANAIVRNFAIIDFPFLLIVASGVYRPVIFKSLVRHFIKGMLVKILSKPSTPQF